MAEQLTRQFDGFSYAINYACRPLPYSWYWMSLGQLEDLRRCQDDYRPRWWAVPDQVTGTDWVDPIPARGTVYRQFGVPCGSYLWAVNFAAVDAEPGDFSFNVTDAGTGIMLCQQVACANNVRAAGTGDSFTGDTDALYPPVQLLPQPKLFIEPGQVSVELTNNSGTDAIAQLLLFFAEPKRLIVR